MQELLVTARAAADSAARIHRVEYGKVAIADAQLKGAADFVSRVDLEAQEAALGIIRSAFPDHRILAEEEGAGAMDGDGTRGDRSTPVWVVDPLDGTTNFLHAHPAHCASVGVVLNGKPVVGAITAQATEERWWALEGGGAFRNGTRVRVSNMDALRGALVGTGFPFKHLQYLPTYLPQLERVVRETAGVRRWGSAALDLCYLAQGSLDIFWEYGLSPWDVAGGLALLAEAGGVAEELDGSEVDPLLEEGRLMLAGNSSRLVASLRTLLQAAPEKSGQD